MKSNRVTTALIGCGAVSQILYVPALAILQNSSLIDIVALVDPNPERTALINQTFPSARQYQDLQIMLNQHTPDLAIVAAPHRLHEVLTNACLERKIHVLCEKPMAPTTADCDRMIKAADDSKCWLAIGHFRRFFPSTQMVKDILEAGILGEVKSFLFLDGENYMWPAQSASFFKREESGGGVLMDMGAHTLDLLLWWLGDVDEVSYQDDAMGGVEANCRLYLRMMNGAQGMVQLSRDCDLPNRYVIECEKGWVTYRCDVVDRIEWGLYHSDYGLNAEINLMATKLQTNTRRLGPAVNGYMDCFVAQLRNMVAVIQGIGSLRVPGTEARKCIALIEKCYNNRQLLNMPWLDPVEIQRAKELADA